MQYTYTVARTVHSISFPHPDPEFDYLILIRNARVPEIATHSKFVSHAVCRASGCDENHFKRI